MSKFSIVLRSVIYNVVFYANLVFWVLLGIPTYLMPRYGILWIAKMWGLTSIWLLEKICRVKLEYRGLEKLKNEPLIIAAKHQSMFETFALVSVLKEPLYILKRELTWLPFFGWYLIKAEMIAINRAAGKSALVDMTKRAREEIRSGRQLIIFPEGTRKSVGAPPTYKYGVSQIYVECDVPCIPVALNSGLFWPRRKFLRYPGTLVIEILDPIQPGLSAEDFLRTLEAKIEDASNRLIDAGLREQAALFGRSPVLTPSEDASS